ncbi:VOC family protein [Enterovibrio sp. 27052020O]|uniref:VOC family protein n=1 Tax=Enterovibrio sp. 27052020O TaxID=3241166 RepID=UPI00388FA440
MNQHGKINYVEFPACDLLATKSFFSEAFGWTFTDFGPDYTAFSDQGLDGGFFRADQHADTANGSALIVLFSDSLEQTEINVRQTGGKIVKPIFEFPGGRRFHFTEPSGNEFAVWSDK